MRICVVSLGCSKNQVDAQTMLNLLAEGGCEVVSDPALAEVIIVNTCGFITSAKEESISSILDMAAYKKRGCCKALIVTGCLSQRYAQQMPADLPEVDAFVGIGHIGDILAIARNALNGQRAVIAEEGYKFVESTHLPHNPSHSAYIKVADGCDNRCSYCAIPLIRGGYVSRSMESILKEARALAGMGAVELLPVAQDTTRYGEDIYGEPRLLELLGELCRIQGVEWVRPLYLYPDWLTKRYIDELSGMEKVCKYLDLPIQHAHDDILAKMRRRGGIDHIRSVLLYARERGFALRTTIITGFPGETDEHFATLLSFIEEMGFDRLGAFAYSQEEDTDAAGFEQVPESVRKERERAVMRLQRKISRRRLKARVGTPELVLIEGETGGEYGYSARSRFEAPDVDGRIFVKAVGQRFKPGDFANVIITGSGDHDLFAEVRP